MNISFTPQVVKVTAQPPGLKAQTATAGEDVIITPQALAVSALSSALGVDIQNPIGREVIQGLVYERGEWTPQNNVTKGSIPFTNEHEKPPAFFIVMAKTTPETYEQYTNIGIVGLSLEYLFEQPIVWNVAHIYGYIDGIVTMNGTSPSSAMAILSKDAASSGTMSYSYYATKTSLTPYFSGSFYFRKSMTYNWLAVWAAE